MSTHTLAKNCSFCRVAVFCKIKGLWSMWNLHWTSALCVSVEFYAGTTCIVTYHFWEIHKNFYSSVLNLQSWPKIQPSIWKQTESVFSSLYEHIVFYFSIFFSYFMVYETIEFHSMKNGGREEQKTLLQVYDLELSVMSYLKKNN